MPTPTEELKIEHQAIKRMLGILTRACARIEAGSPVDPAHLDAAVEFIRVFADKCHHGKEEDLLFPAMVAAGVPDQGGPIGVMKAEHTRGRELVRKAAAALPGLKRKDRAAAADFVAQARGYAALLGPHIDKEDFILYPMADRLLAKSVQAGLSKEFERVEDEIIGGGSHERFHRLLDDLEAAYPPA
ncbi:MAG: hemerythrin domain-containing protein [Candidatus Aminicenantes bacterium]|nr:hemerythrin domain-containing protein [Candidatus Aminicenantes bacterium]